MNGLDDELDRLDRVECRLRSVARRLAGTREERIAAFKRAELLWERYAAVFVDSEPHV